MIVLQGGTLHHGHTFPYISPKTDKHERTFGHYNPNDPRAFPAEPQDIVPRLKNSLNSSSNCIDSSNKMSDAGSLIFKPTPTTDPILFTAQESSKVNKLMALMTPGMLISVMSINLLRLFFVHILLFCING